MPTAPKMVAGIYFAALSFLVAQLYLPQLPEGTPPGILREVSAAIGFLCGWFVMGRLVGKGYSEAMNSGLRTIITVVILVMAGFASVKMIERSLMMLYDGPMEALQAIFQIMFDYGRYLIAPNVFGAVLLGGVLGGQVTEWVARRWN